MEWIRFFITAALLLFGVAAFAASVLGVWRFGFIMNRLHAAGMGDTMGIFCIVTGLIVSAGSGMDALKLMLLVFFMWFSSPASTHLLSQVEYYNNKELSKFVSYLGNISNESDVAADPDAAVQQEGGSHVSD